jgi:hypothetical protein
MRTILLLAICLTSLFGFSQEESDYEDTVDFDIYTILDHNKWTIEEFTPSEENYEWSKLTRITYNPIVNLEVFDSIISYRESKGLKSIKVDYDKIQSRMHNTQIYYAMDISKMEMSKVVMRQMEGVVDCECGTSIVDLALDDSLFYGKDKFKDLLLNKHIKRIEINYCQVSRKNDPDKKEEHLFIAIKKRFRLFKTTYDLM